MKEFEGRLKYRFIGTSPLRQQIVPTKKQVLLKLDIERMSPALISRSLKKTTLGNVPL